MQSLISVYIPTCNRRELLERAVNSVLTQTYPNVEIIIVDDCSEDDTQFFCENLVRQHINVIYLRNEVRSGACVSRNKAIKIAKGEFITGLDDDDYFLPSRLDTLFDALSINNYQIVFSDCQVLSKEGVIKILRRKSVVKKKDLLRSNYIGNQVFTYTKHLKSIGGFSELMPAWQDLECWYRLLNISDANCIHSASYLVYISHPHERITNGKIEKIRYAFEKFCLEHKLNEKQKAELSIQFGHYLKKTSYDIKVVFLNVSLCNFISAGLCFKFSLKRLLLRVVGRKI